MVNFVHLACKISCLCRKAGFWQIGPSPENRPAMSLADDLTRRRGGRDARRALRSRDIPRAEAAVKPGQVGGQYKPLSQRDMERIHEAALTLLETVGFGQAIPSCIEAMTARGCTMNEAGRLLIPRSLTEDILASCARNFPLYARDSQHDMQPSGNRVYFGTAGAAVHVVEPETRSYR
jgi:trimethylamine--corrinoid protein Co-methyltransferase